MKNFVVCIFLVLALSQVLTSAGSVKNVFFKIPGHDHTRVGYASKYAPVCTEDNYFCLLPDTEDGNIFYRCLEVGNQAFTHNCLPGNSFIFEKQFCGSPTEWKKPQAPFKCADVSK